MSVGLKKAIPGTRSQQVQLRYDVALAVASPISRNSTENALLGKLVHYELPNRYCNPNFVRKCEPLLSFDIRWGVFCHPGYYPRGSCALFNSTFREKILNKTDDDDDDDEFAGFTSQSDDDDGFGGNSSRRPTAHPTTKHYSRRRWYNQRPRTTAPRGNSPKGKGRQVVSVPNKKEKDDSKLAIAIGIPLGFLAFAVVACVVGFLASSRGKNGSSTLHPRVAFMRLRGKTDPLLDSDR